MFTLFGFLGAIVWAALWPLRVTARVAWWAFRASPRPVKLLFVLGPIVGLGIFLRPVFRIDLQKVDRVGNGIPYDKISPRVLLADQVIEDRTFTERKTPFVFSSLVRAVFANIRGHRQGGSTIDQQVSRILLNDYKPTLHRKLLEAVMAIRLRRELSKEAIMEIHLNKATFAGDVTGLRAASYRWFGREPNDDLHPAELYALLYSLRRPSYYNTPDKLKAAALACMKNAAALGYIDAAGHEKAIEEMRFVPRNAGIMKPPVRNPRPQDAWPAGLLSDVMRSLPADVKERIDREHLSVEATIDEPLQRALQCMLTERLEAMEAQHPNFDIQASMVVMDTATGEIRAMVSRDPNREFSLSTQAHRPIGSLEKPFIALAALESGVAANIESPFVDAPLDNTDWPHDCGREWSRKPVTLKFALKDSLNTVFAHLFLEKNVAGELVRIHQQLNLPKVNPADRAESLGSIEATNLQIAAAYNAISRHGEYSSPTLVRSVTDGGAGIVWQPQRIVRQAFSSSHAGEILIAMHEAWLSGTGKHLPRELKNACIKTGTTSAQGGATRDLRLAYIHPGQFVAVIWIGCEKGAIWKEAVAGRDLAPFAGPLLLECEKRFRSKN